MEFDHVAQQVPDIAAAVDWWREAVPGTKVLYQDETWGLIEAAGAKLAFVMAAQHPNHLAFRVGVGELEELAARHGAPVDGHRDGSRSFYLPAPGDQRIEFIAYPEA